MEKNNKVIFTGAPHNGLNLLEDKSSSLLYIYKPIIDHDYYSPKNLTIGKLYEVYNVESYHWNYYTLVNDNGIKYSYDKSLFKTLDEFRNEKILTILND